MVAFRNDGPGFDAVMRAILEVMRRDPNFLDGDDLELVNREEDFSFEDFCREHGLVAPDHKFITEMNAEELREYDRAHNGGSQGPDAG